ncbi:MAG TPA: heavy metal-binding domain-containing protein [Abditibacterium sp.]|jgi:uncharacterized protein YbjQ (UPF0145 family)
MTQSNLPHYVPGQMQGLPDAAKARMEHNKPGAKGGLWTSDLSVSEFLLVRDAGFEPLGLVMGCSIYHIGFQWVNPFQGQEMEVLTQAMYSARELAMTRMQEEADLLGADGIVGVRLEVNRHAFGQNLAEFLAIGTAIRHIGGGNYRTKQNKPFTSDLSGQDFWTLLHSGYRPVSLVMGNCVYQVRMQGIGQAFSQIGRNVEMENYTQGLYDARELALTRMQAEAEAEGGEGIVSVELQESSHGWGAHTIEYFAIGTSILQISPDHSIPKPQMTLSLNDSRQRIEKPVASPK